MNTFESEPPPMTLVDLVPPWWRRPLTHLEGTRAGDLGFPDHHPARPGHDQKEDVLTPQFARQGYSSNAAASSSSSSQPALAPPIAVAIETVSLAGPIYEKLKKNGMVQRLEAMGREVEVERGKLRGAVSEVPPHTYRPPTRTIHNPLMRQNFLSALANSSIPLSKLSRNVPHGIKGEGMLELVWKSKVGVERVGWFVGVVGGLEVQAGRSRMALGSSSNTGMTMTGPSTPTPTMTSMNAMVILSAEEAYTIEFTKTFFGWLKKHLTEIIPAGSNVNGSGAVAETMGECLLDDEERRRVWVEKWEYIRSLAFHFKNRRFLHPRTITRWFTLEIAESHIIPLNFTLDLLDGFHQVVLPPLALGIQADSRADGVWGRRMIGACLTRIQAIRGMRVGEAAKPLERSLGAIVKTGWQTDRRYVLSPRNWRSHEDLLREIVVGNLHLPETVNEFDRVKSRSHWLSMRIKRPVERSASAQPDKGKGREASPVTSATPVDKVLDRVTSSTSDPIRTLVKTLFGGDAFGQDRRAATRSRINEVLDWMASRHRVDPRSAVLGSSVVKQAVMDDIEPVLSLALDQAKERSRRYHFVTSIVLEWVGRLANDPHRPDDALDSVVHVLGRVVQVGLIDYEDFLGYMVTVADTDESAFLRDILAILPYFGQDETTVFQRRMLLHGSDTKAQAQEQQRIDRFDFELRSYLGDLVDNDKSPLSSQSPRETSGLEFPSSWVCSRVWAHVRPKVLQRIRAFTSDSDLGSTRMGRLTSVTTAIPDYELLFEVCRQMTLVRISDAAVQLACCQQLQRNLLLWDAISCGAEAKGLVHTLRTNASTMIANRCTSPKLDDSRPSTSSDPILNSTAQLFRDVVEIHRQPSLDAVDRLAQGLIQEFPNDRQFGEQVWNLALAGLADIDITLLQPEGESKAVEATVRLLQTLGTHHPGMMDVAFRRWARSVLRKPTLATVNEQSCSLLLELAAKRVVPLRSVLEGLLLPLWRSMAAFVSSATQAVPEQSRFILVLSRAIFRSRTIGSAISLSTAHALTAELEMALEDTALATNLIKHLPFLAVIAVDANSSHDMARFLGELCHVEPLKIFALREQAVVREAVTKAPFSWEGYQGARDLVEGCIRDLLNTSTSVGKSSRAESTTLCTFLGDWPCLSTNSDAETQTRLKTALRRYITDASKDASDDSEALAVLFQTRLTVTHRIALFDGLLGLNSSVVKVFIAKGIAYLQRLYEDNYLDGQPRKQNILHHAMDIVWMFACAWTVSSVDDQTEAPPDVQRYDSDSLLANLDSLCHNINTATSHASVFDGALLAVLRSVQEDGPARSGYSRGFVLGLSELFTRSSNREDLGVYLLDELPESEAETLLNTKQDGGTDTADSPTTETYFNSVWESITTGIDDPYAKTDLENADPIDLAAFEPKFMWENSNKMPPDLSSLMRRPPTERDLDLGTTTLPLFARSMLYDLHDTSHDTNNDGASSTRARSMSATPRAYGTGNDPIEIDDSPPLVPTKSKKRPYPQDSPVKNQKKLDRKGSTSASKPIAPAPKRKTKRE